MVDCNLINTHHLDFFSDRYAFVTMADADSADAAVKELNGAIIDGKEVKVDRARERGSGGGGRGGYGGGRGGGQFFIMSTEFDKNISD